jgi:hypothetical protein
MAAMAATASVHGETLGEPSARLRAMMEGTPVRLFTPFLSLSRARSSPNSGARTSAESSFHVSGWRRIDALSASRRVPRVPCWPALSPRARIGPVTRLPVLESTIEQLYGTATICAYPDCPEPLLRWINGVETPVLNSRIAHIAAASERGPRYDANMTDARPRTFYFFASRTLKRSTSRRSRTDTRPEVLHQWKAAQLQAAPAEPPIIPEGLLERAVLPSMGDVLLDFREANIDLGGKPAPGAGGSGGGAIGPGARGGDGGPGGSMNTFTVTGAQVPRRGLDRDRPPGSRRRRRDARRSRWPHAIRHPCHPWGVRPRAQSCPAARPGSINHRHEPSIGGAKDQGLVAR